MTSSRCRTGAWVRLHRSLVWARCFGSSSKQERYLQLHEDFADFPRRLRSRERRRVSWRHASGEEGACMRRRSKKLIRRKIVLRLPDLDYAKSVVLCSLNSPSSRPNYKFAMEQFITCYCSEPRLALNCREWHQHAEDGIVDGLGPSDRQHRGGDRAGAKNHGGVSDDRTKASAPCPVQPVRFYAGGVWGSQPLS